MVRLLRESSHGLFAGGYVGAVAGTAEAVHLLGNPAAPVHADLLLTAALLYALLGALIGIAAGALAAIVEIRPFNQPGAGVGMAVNTVATVFLLVALRPTLLGSFPPGPEILQDLACVGVAVLLWTFATVAGLNHLYGGRVWATALSLVVVLLLNAGLTGLSIHFLTADGWRGLQREAASQPLPRFPAAVPDALRDAPNTLFIVVDSLRRDRVQPYGGSVPTSAMARLARDGVVFEQAVAASSATAPAIASLITGRSPVRHGVRGDGDKLPTRVATLFEAQRGANVATGAVLNHSALDKKQGFAQGVQFFRRQAQPAAARQTLRAPTSDYEHLAVVKLWNRLIDALAGDAPRRARPQAVEGERTPAFPTSPEGERARPAEAVLDDARSFLQAAGSTRWSLLVHLMEPHAPYEGHALGEGWGPVDRLGPEERYAREVVRVDRALGRFLQWLEAQGLYDDTVIVLTASHGEELGDHGAYGHGETLYDEVVLVPLIMKLPGSVFRGTRYRGQVRAFDAFVTAVALQGVDLPSGVEWPEDGSRDNLIDELELDPPLGLRREECNLRAYAATRPALSEVRVGRGVVRSIRQEGYKLVRAPSGNPRKLPNEVFYDVLNDPGETRDRSGSRDGACGAARKYERDLARSLDRVDGGGSSAREDGRRFRIRWPFGRKGDQG